MTKIVELIGDMRILHTVLEGFLAGWTGTFDVRPADDPDPKEYLFNAGNLSEFCRKIKSSPVGERLCKKCDEDHARQAKKKGRPIHYLCHAGLLDIAVPIIVGDELIATIFCGQCRPWTASMDEEGRKRTRRIARTLGFDQGELLALRTQARPVTREEITDAKNRLSIVATYMAAQGHEKARLAGEKSELEQTRNKMIKEGQQIQNVISTLSAIVDVDMFWSKLDIALDRICETVGADCAAVFVSDGNAPFYIKSLAGLDRQRFAEFYPGDTASFRRVFGETAEGRAFRIVGISPSDAETFGSAVASIYQPPPDKVVMIPFELAGENQALMLLFLKEVMDTSSSLPIEKEAEILSQVAPQIAIAYQNCVLYTQQRELAREKGAFLEDMAHQIIAPLSGIQADSDRLLRYLDKWDRTRIVNQVSAIKGVSRSAARLARNLVWVAVTGGHTLRAVERAPISGLLIGCAMDVQGVAAYKGLRVNVDTASTDRLPELAIDRERFSQAVVNLLDNAVKYSKRGTEVYIDAKCSDACALISVTNYGIPLRAEDMERIFERGERTREAQEAVPSGTGIGLPVAREIIRLHGGDLYATASVLDEKQKAYKTVFTISVPIRPMEA
jgi:signal transduction histidine kinase/ligand-binding sensor protein